MSEETLISKCSPTMAGLKTGNLFSYRFKDRRELNESIRRFNRYLVPKGVRLLPMNVRDGRALLYMYRPDRRPNVVNVSAHGRFMEMSAPRSGHFVFIINVRAATTARILSTSPSNGWLSVHDMM